MGSSENNIEEALQKACQDREYVRKHQGLVLSYRRISEFSQAPLRRDPTYTFEVGDLVDYGIYKDAKIRRVSDIPFKGRIYEICFTDMNGREQLQAVHWHQIRPAASLRSLQKTVAHVNVEKLPQISREETTIGLLLRQYYNFGVNLDPEYQAGITEWAHAEQEAYLESVFDDSADLGRIIFVCRKSLDDLLEEGYDCAVYDVLDGRQRLKTLIDFYENRIPFHHVYYNDLCEEDRNSFLQKSISFGEVMENISELDTLSLFFAVNRGSKVLDDPYVVTTLRQRLENLKEEDKDIKQEQNYSEYE